MKLLINICSHDGIISHYNGVGTMTLKYIETFTKLCNNLNIEYTFNLFTPEYNSNSFGYSKKIHEKHNNLKNTTIYQINNGSNQKINFGTLQNWKLLCKNTAKIINKIDKKEYDKILTICNDTPFCCLINQLNCSDNHIKVLILHSSIKIHKIDSAIANSEKHYKERLSWESDGINYINKEKNSYIGSICKYFENHLIKEYNLNKNKILNIQNGELLEKAETETKNYSNESKKIVNELSKYKSLIISFGRAEEYKNLDVCFPLGKKLNIPAIMIGQLYFKGQPIEKKYQKKAKQYNGMLYIDPPFDLAKCILNTFNGKIICLVPSKKEIMGLIINEVRNLKKDNILIVANNIGGLKEQITNGYDGILVNLNDLDKSSKTIIKYFNEKEIKRISKNSIKTLEKKYDFYKIAKDFLEDIIRR